MLDQTVTDVIVKSETPKRTRRTKQEMAAAQTADLGAALEKMGYDLEELEQDNPYNPTVEIIDLQPLQPISQYDYVHQCIEQANLASKIAEVHIAVEPDGSIRTVEFRGIDGVSFIVPQLGEVKWVMFVGKLDQFPTMLASLRVLETF